MNKNNSSPESQTDWDRLESMQDEDIDLSDIPELTAEDFKRAKPTRQFFAERGIEFDPGGPHQVNVRHEDSATTSYELPGSEAQLILLDPDVRAYFPDSESVNRTLRSLIALIPHKQT
jgi:hypothetical protein